MLGSPDTETVTAINRLENDSDFRKIVGWLRREHAEIMSSLVASNADPGVHRGACRVLESFLSEVDGAYIPPQIAEGRKF